MNKLTKTIYFITALGLGGAAIAKQAPAPVVDLSSNAQYDHTNLAYNSATNNMPQTSVSDSSSGIVDTSTLYIV